MQGAQQEGCCFFGTQEFWRGWLLKWGRSPILVFLETMRMGFYGLFRALWAVEGKKEEGVVGRVSFD